MKIVSPQMVCSKIKKNINIYEKLAFFTTLIVGLINNFNFIITHGVAPDVIGTQPFHIAGKWEASLGRPGIQILDNIRGGFDNKFIIILECLFFLSFAVLFLVKTFNIKNKIVVVLLSCVIAVAPQFTETYMFIYCADSYCLAMLLAVLSIYFLNKADYKKINYLYAIICIITLCTLYQAYLGVVIGLCFLLIIKHLLDNKKIKETFIKSLEYIGVIFIGVVIYYIFMNIFLNIMGIQFATYKGANGLGIDTMKNLPKSIMHCYADFVSFFFGNKIIYNHFWKRRYLNLGIYCLLIVSMFFILKKKEYENKKMRILFIGAIFCILPIGVNIINIIAPNTTINLVTGPGLIVFYILSLIMYNYLVDDTFENIIKHIALFVFNVLIITFILSNNVTYSVREETYQNYYTISNNIYEKVQQLDNYNNNLKWMFSDVIYYKSSKAYMANGFISNDNETWANYDGTVTNKIFYKKYLNVNIDICSKEQYNKIINTNQFKSMPVYPLNGSIAIIDNTIVIKISENTF